jgi:hypothetical protein
MKALFVENGFAGIWEMARLCNFRMLGFCFLEVSLEASVH